MYVLARVASAFFGVSTLNKKLVVIAIANGTASAYHEYLNTRESCFLRFRNRPMIYRVLIILFMQGNRVTLTLKDGSARPGVSPHSRLT